MKYYCVIILLAFTCKTNCQNTFFNIFDTNQEERSFEVIQTNAGDFIIVGERRTEYSVDDSKGLILLIDENGQLKKEFTINNDNISALTTIDKKSGDNDSYLATGFQDSVFSNDRVSSMQVYEINENIEILSKNTVFSLYNILLRPWKTSVVNDTTILLLSSYRDISLTFPPHQSIITEIKLPADSIRSYTSSIDFTCTPQDILYIPENHETHVFYFGSHLYDRSFIKILRLDQLLNGISTLETPTDMISTACATLLNDSSYLLTGTASPASGLTTTRDIAVFEMDENGNSIDGIQYNNHPDTITYGGAGTNTTIIGDTIFIVGVHNLDPSAVPWQNTPTWIQITKLDLDLSIISHSFFGGDMMYFPYCVISTNDNCLLITGYVWDYKIGEMQHDIFALKLNSNGMIVNVPENATWQATEAILYPNPVRDNVNIEFSQVYQTASFQLMDIGGELILDKQLNSNYQRVNISGIPAGTYVYRIFNKEGLDERGKVVIE